MVRYTNLLKLSFSVRYINIYCTASYKYGFGTLPYTVIVMPREGYRTITVKAEIHKELEDFAEQTHRSVPQTIEYLIDHCRPILHSEVAAVQVKEAGS